MKEVNYQSYSKYFVAYVRLSYTQKVKIIKKVDDNKRVYWEMILDSIDKLIEIRRNYENSDIFRYVEELINIGAEIREQWKK